MSDTYCGKCGTLVRPNDLYCRKCGNPLIFPPDWAEQSPVRQSQPQKEQIPAQNRIGSRLLTCAILAGCFFLLAIALAGFVFVSLPGQPGGRPFIYAQMEDTSTPYPTRRPYSTAGPYRTSTPYVTALPYPTTGPLATIMPTPTGSSALPHYVAPPFISPLSGGCDLIVINQYPDLDGVVLLENASTKKISKAVYVRANDTFSTSGISAGTYNAYVALGRDWDALTGRFRNHAIYQRFTDQDVFTSCPAIYSIFSRRESLTITLNVSGGSGSASENVMPDGFPRLSP
jgi:hypothetical protein